MRTFVTLARPATVGGLAFLLACSGGTDGKDDTDTDGLDSETETETEDTGVATPVVRFTVAAPRTTDDLVAVLDNPDAAATYRWRWTQVAGGPATARPDFDDLTTVPAAATRRDETWRVTVIGTKDGEDSEPGFVEVVIANTPPTATVQITPDPATAGDDLVATVLTEDADEDEVDLSYVWSKNGVATAFRDGTISATNLVRDELWAVVVTPTDGTDAGLPVSDDIVIANSPPVISAADLSPTAPNTRQTLSGAVTAADPDGDRVTTITYTWFVNGTQVRTGTVDTLSDTLSAKGDEVWFTAEATDQSGAKSAPFTSNTVRIVNSPPRFDRVELTPTEADVRSTFTCTPMLWEDDDNDPANYRYTWELDGVEIAGQTQATLAGSFTQKGKVVTCTATPDDGNDLGVALTSNGVLLRNAPPALTAVTLGPTPLQVGTTITATATGVADPDGDAVTLRYAWTKDGLPLQGVTGSTLTGGYEPNDIIRVTVTPVDAVGLVGTAVSSIDYAVRNRLPTVSEVTLLPLPLRTNDTATAFATALDEDGQPVTITYRWRVNDVRVREVADTEGDGDELPGSFFDKGDTVVVTALPSDGLGPFGTPRTAGPYTVANTAPYALFATISPSAPVEASTLTCTVTGFGDVDGDPEGYIWRWQIGTRLMQTPTNQLTGASFDKGDDVGCVAIPSDGTDQGSQVLSVPVRIGNTAPTLTSVTIGPSNPSSFDTLSATMSGAADVDRADTVSFRYRWTVEGADVSTGATLPGGAWKPGDSIRLYVRPYDGTDEGPEVASNVLTAQNGNPSVLGISLQPARPRTNDPIKAVVTGFDPDGDALVISHQWLVNGVPVPGATTDLLDPVHTERGDLVRVTATVRDPAGATDTETSDAIEVVNTKPTLASAAIDPPTLTELSTATCVPSGWNDADGDAVQVRTSWYRDLVLVSREPTITGALFDKGQRITCRLEPFDDDPEGGGPQVTSPGVVVGNSPPTLDGVVLSDPLPDKTIEVTGIPGVADDPDPADDVTFAWRWLVNGVEVSIGEKLTPDKFAKGDEIQVAARPWDGVVFGAEVLSDVGVVQNTAPEVLAAVIGPSGATLADTLELDVLADDPDGDALSWTVTWFVDGVEVASGVDLLTLAPGAFTTGSIVTADIVPNDGEVDGALFTSDPLLVGNAPPSITSVVIAPLPATEASVLTCTPSGWNDPDGDPPGYLYRWLVDGVVRSANPTLDGRTFSRDDEVICRVIPTDGFSSGDPVDSAPTIIQNTPPTVSSVALSRISPREADTVGVVVAGAFDRDGDTMVTTYRWLVDGAEVATSASITGALFDKGQTIQAEVTISDGTDAIVRLTTSTTAVNTAPSIVTLVVAPHDPLVTQDIVAQASATDPDPADQGSLTIGYAWSVNGGGLPLVTGDTLPAGNFSKGQSIQVIATPHDGVTFGAGVASDVLVARNSLPRVTGVSITPTTPTRATGAECVPLGFEDDDGDGVDFDYQWYVDETPSGTTASLSPSSYERGAVLRCEVVAFDGEEFGPSFVSDTVVVGNAPPTIAVVNINPQPVRETTVPTAVVLGVEDLDGDVVTWLVTWYVDDGSPFVSPNIDGTRFSRGQTLRAEAVPNDGFTDGPTRSSETIVVANTPPQVVGPIDVQPLSIKATNPVVANVSGTDADGDAVTMRWTFLVDGVVVQEGWSNTLPTGSYVRGDVLQVRATPWDGVEFGAPLSTTGSVVENSTPTVPVVLATPTYVNPGVDSPLCSITTTSTDADGDTVQYQFRWRDASIVLTRSPGTATTNTLDKSFVGDGDLWQCDARSYDGLSYSAWSPTSTVTGRYPYYPSCADHKVQGGVTSGVYTIDPDGQFGSQAPFDVWCDQTTGDGGWVRILRTDGQDEDFGQRGYAIVNSYAGVTASRGVYEAFRQFSQFEEVMLRAVTGAQAGRWRQYSLTGASELTMLEYLEGCRDEDLYLGDDTWYDQVKTNGHTFQRSGSASGGDLMVYPDDGSAPRPPIYMFVCGVNTSSDNDVSYLAFSDASGWENDWGDGWRGLGQKGTLWSFANGNYCCSGDTHIGASGLQTLAGWKGTAGTPAATNHAGTYEVYVR